jgi:8-amino-7-oxononanoate synthase
MPNFHLPFKLALHLKMLVRTLFNQLQTLMTKYGSQNATAALIGVPSECPQSSIFAILTPHPRSLAKHCQDGGFVVRAVVPPTVPVGSSRIRVCLHAGNTTEQIRKLVERIDDWVSLQLGQQEAESNSWGTWAEKARL